MQESTITKTIEGRQFESRKSESCSGCAGEKDADTCVMLGRCTPSRNPLGASIIWIEVKPAQARLTKAEIDDLKKIAVDQYGATWLHEFGSFVEAEVYARLGVALPAADGSPT